MKTNDEQIACAISLNERIFNTMLKMQQPLSHQEVKSERSFSHLWLQSAPELFSILVFIDFSDFLELNDSLSCMNLGTKCKKLSASFDKEVLNLNFEDTFSDIDEDVFIDPEIEQSLLVDDDDPEEQKSNTIKPGLKQFTRIETIVNLQSSTPVIKQRNSAINGQQNIENLLKEDLRETIEINRRHKLAVSQHKNEVEGRNVVNLKSPTPVKQNGLTINSLQRISNSRRKKCQTNDNNHKYKVGVHLQRNDSQQHIALFTRKKLLNTHKDTNHMPNNIEIFQQLTNRIVYETPLIPQLTERRVSSNRMKLTDILHQSRDSSTPQDLTITKYVDTDEKKRRMDSDIDSNECSTNGERNQENELRRKTANNNPKLIVVSCNVLKNSRNISVDSR